MNLESQEQNDVIKILRFTLPLERNSSNTLTALGNILYYFLYANRS